MVRYFKKRFYPQNFIIVKSDDTDSIIEELSNEAAGIAPNCFDAEVKSFDFILNYQPPYSEFTELKRLQSETIKNTRFKDEYHGFIAIDISEWANHFVEEFFMIASTFLSDMSDSWKYIFLVDDENAAKNASQAFEQIIPEMRILSIKNKSNSKINFSESLADEIGKTHKKAFTLSAKELLKSVFNTGSHTKNDVVTSAKDIASYFSSEEKITVALLAEYLSDEFTYMRTYMTSEEVAKFNDYVLGWEVKR